MPQFEVRARLARSCLIALLALAAPPLATAQVYRLLEADTAAAYRYPGADGRVGTADDIISADVTTVVGSDPNLLGRHSYAAFQTFVADPALPGANTAISFVGGSVEIDPLVAASGGGPLIVSASAAGTGFGQGLPDASLTIVAVSGGSYDPLTGAMTLEADIEASAAGITRQFAGASVSGTATIIESSDFATATGDAYLDNVLIPHAQALNASGLFLIEFSGTAPLDPPWVIIPAPFTVVLAGLTGVPNGSTADLSVDKAGPVAPAVAGETISFTVTASNAGVGTASGVTVYDRFGDSLTWSSDSCGAGPPTSGLLTWTVGTLGPGAQASCQIQVTLAADTPFDVHNAGVVLAQTYDPVVTDNVAAITVSADPPAPVEGLAQDPDQATGFPSDRDCDSCPLGAQAMAENFRVAQQLTLEAVTFHGGYTDNLPFADEFTVEVRADAETSTQPGVPGIPGDLIASATGGGSRAATGNLVAGFFDEYRYRVAIEATLQRGRYWIVIHNDSTAGPDGGDWFWASGQADPDNRSLPTTAANQTIPPHPRWSPTSGLQLALSIEPGRAEPIPALRNAGTFAMMLGVMALALTTLRVRKRRANPTPTARRNA